MISKSANLIFSVTVRPRLPTDSQWRREHGVEFNFHQGTVPRDRHLVPFPPLYPTKPL
jgi:hypothetical protein